MIHFHTKKIKEVLDNPDWRSWILGMQSQIYDTAK